MYLEKNKRVLIIMPKPPFPMADGGCIAMANTMTIWKKSGLDVHVFCLSTPKHPFQPHAFPKEWTEGKNLFHHFVDTNFHLSDLAFILFSSQSYQAHRFFCWEAMKKIQFLINQNHYDIILFDSLYSAIYLSEIKKIFNGKIFLRSHNVEHQIWYSLRAKEPNLLKRLVLLHETNRLKRWEKCVYEQVDGIFTITAYDQLATHHMSPKTPVVNLPVSMIIPDTIQNRSLHIPLRLFHLGAMNWAPNQDAIHWFINEWFPPILQKFPDITFHFAGKGMPSSFFNLGLKQVYCHGEVPDASAFMQQYDVLVVPLRHGSGLRIKILEAMAHGIPVISTSKGAEGISVTHGENILLADNPVSFAKAVDQLIHTPGLYEHISQQSINFIQKNYSEETCKTIIQSMVNA